MTQVHRFFCLNCGKEGIPIQRNIGKQRGRMHRKRLYCLNCRQEVNMIECYDEYDVEKFQRNFERGVYKNEAEESIVHCGGSSK